MTRPDREPIAFAQTVLGSKWQRIYMDANTKQTHKHKANIQTHRHTYKQKHTETYENRHTSTQQTTRQDTTRGHIMQLPEKTVGDTTRTATLLS